MRRSFFHFKATWLSLSLFLLPTVHYAQAQTAVAVIVSSAQSHRYTQAIQAEELKLIFWCKKRYWSGGHRIYPANLHAEHPIRLLFSNSVLNSLPNEQINYWNGLYFHGSRPPHSLQSEEAMIRYVAETKGAIGYISACLLDQRVKPILWIVNNQLTDKAPDKISCDNP